MKRIVMFFLAAMLLLGFTGQAMAYFTAGDLIQVVYVSGGVGNEVLTDLGPVSSTTGPITTGINASTLSTDFGSYTWKDLNVAYFTFTPQNGATANFWMSGPSGGQTNAGSLKPSVKAGMNSVMTNAFTASGNGASNQVVQSSSSSSSYWTMLDKNGLGVGTFNNYVTSANGEASLLALATGGTASLSLYYYPNASSGVAGSGAELATLTMANDGTTTVTPQATPIPATFLLFGSGLLGLVGIRRKQTA